MLGMEGIQVKNTGAYSDNLNYAGLSCSDGDIYLNLFLGFVLKAMK